MKTSLFYAFNGPGCLVGMISSSEGFLVIWKAHIRTLNGAKALATIASAIVFLPLGWEVHGTKPTVVWGIDGSYRLHSTQ